jgi:hypothetical protein
MHPGPSGRRPEPITPAGAAPGLGPGRGVPVSLALQRGQGPRPVASAEVDRLVRADRRRRAWAVRVIEGPLASAQGEHDRAVSKTCPEDRTELRWHPDRPLGAASSVLLRLGGDRTGYGGPALIRFAGRQRLRRPGAYLPATRATPTAARAIWMRSSIQSIPGAADPKALAMKMPMRAATMPIRMVSQMGMAWRPGRTSRPRAPMMRPTRWR